MKNYFIVSPLARMISRKVFQNFMEFIKSTYRMERQNLINSEGENLLKEKEKELLTNDSKQLVEIGNCLKDIRALLIANALCEGGIRFAFLLESVIEKEGMSNELIKKYFDI